jgi:uncharacterized phage-associated protein
LLGCPEATCYNAQLESFRTSLLVASGTLMNFRFDHDKTLQASALLLDLAAGRMAYVRLLKLLYIADREWLAEAGRSMTGDEAIAMKNGPVPSHVYDLIKGIAPRADHWSDHIQKVDYCVELKKDPGRGTLSKGEIEKLIEVTERFRTMDDWELSEHTHEFPEWRNHFQPDASSPIPWREILEAQGKTEIVPIVEQNEAAHQYLDSLFGA